jgi:hypothetical protein
MFKEETRKSREQKFYEFFRSLQLEYIVAELRYKIYPQGDRKLKSQEIMRMKRDKIFDIAIRNDFNTIFEDIVIGCKKLYCPALKKELYEEVLPEVGCPNFIYRDEKHKEQLEKFDHRCYYSVGSIFLTPQGEGILEHYNYNENKFYVKIKDGVLCCVREDIKRIL